MKKYLLAGLILFSWSLSHAGQDKFGSMRTPVWRSSTTCSVDNFVLLATGNIIVHAVEVTSAAVNTADAHFSMFNTTTPQTVNLTLFQSTAAFLDTAVSRRYEFDAHYSSGTVYDKKGLACTTIIWDYVLPDIKPLTPWRP